MTNEKIVLDMIILMQNDLARSVAFYKDLGLPLKFHVSHKWAELDINGVKLGLAETTQELPERRTGIVFGVKNLQEFYKQKKEDITFIGEPVEAVHGIIISFKDPGNNILDLYQATPEKVKAAVAKATQEAQNQGCCDHNKQETTAQPSQEICC